MRMVVFRASFYGPTAWYRAPTSLCARYVLCGTDLVCCVPRHTSQTRVRSRLDALFPYAFAVRWAIFDAMGRYQVRNPSVLPSYAFALQLQ
eukprot:3270398-Rhodomonas_salina.1